MSSSISISDGPLSVRLHAKPVKPWRFSSVFATVVATTLAVIGAINAFVDPYNLLGINTIGVYASNERLTKPVLIQSGRYSTILIGSSKVAAISPTDIPDLHAFNASFGAALPEEINWLLDRYVKLGQTVLLGLDFYMFNESGFPPVEKNPFSFENRPAPLVYLLSWDVLKTSLRALVSHYVYHEPALVLRDGTRDQTKDWAQHNALADGYDYARVLQTLRTVHYHAVHYSTRRLEILRGLKSRMQTRGARLIVFINPLQREVREIIRQQAEHEFQRFRSDVRLIFPDIYDLTGSEYSGRDLYYRHDPYHYLPAVGACLIGQIAVGKHPIVPPSPAGCR